MGTGECKMTHDFKFILDEILDCETHVHIVKNREAYETIIAALRIADKLMQEPSDEEIERFISIGLPYEESTDSTDAYECIRQEFKAMRDQMLKELAL